MTTDLTARITEILRGQFPLNGNDVHAHVAALIAAAAEQHYREEMGWRVERDRVIKCACRHPKVDHAHVPSSGITNDRKGVTLGACQANRGTRYASCDCKQWQPVERTRLVTEWSPGAGE